MSRRRTVDVEIIPGLTAPVSWGVIWGDVVHVSGVWGRDPATGEWGGIEAQVASCLRSIERILDAAGTSMDHVLSVTTYLASAADYDAYNAVYASFFPASPPARTTVQSGFMFPEMLVEISCLAGIPADG
jgi:2-iminobutanoate/2-iminopropanoate deaminase